MSSSSEHVEHLRRACDLAAHGALDVEPNPRVGALVVRDGRVVGEGWHERYGGAHAEVNALRAAGDLARGATLYVSLEPCSTTGKTPPCTDAIRAAGVSRVVYAAADPDPRHAARARAALPDAVALVGPVAPELASASLARFVRHLAAPRPHVLAKWAMSLDGRIATRDGDSRWISNAASRGRVHGIRGHVDGIAVGIGTVVADRPRLTARPPGPRLARRIVFDRSLRLPLDWEALDDGGPEVVVVTTPTATREKLDALAARGVRVLSIAADSSARYVVDALAELRRIGVERLLVEGGGAMLGAFFEAQCVDQVAAFVAPRIVGGTGATAPVAGLGWSKLALAPRLVETRVTSYADPDAPSSAADVCFEGFVSPAVDE